MIEKELRKQLLKHPQPAFGGSVRRQSSTFQPVPSFLVSYWDSVTSVGTQQKGFQLRPGAHLELLPPISHMCAASLTLLTSTREEENKT